MDHWQGDTVETKEAARLMNEFWRMASPYVHSQPFPEQLRFYLGLKQLRALYRLDRACAQASYTCLEKKTLFGIPYIEVRLDDYVRLV